MKKTALILSVALMISGTAWAGGSKTYEVTITNITSGQIFTPVLAATHNSDISLFELAGMASEPLEIQAEGGNPMPLKAWWDSSSEVLDTVVLDGVVIPPGGHETFEIEGSKKFNRLSFSAMLVPTHDTFVALNSMSLPKRSAMTMVPAYDAGTEINDELCANIPGPCMGEGYSEDGGEGYIHVANGIHGIGDLPPDVSDWRNPVAKVTVRRVK
jgi:hypothetical protein